MMPSEWFFPWESDVMIEHPMAMPIFMGMVSFILSIISWIREGKVKNKQ